MPRTSLIAGLSVPESVIACAIATSLYGGTSAAQDAPPTETPPPAEAAPSTTPTPPSAKPVAKKASAKPKANPAPTTPPPAAAVAAPPPPAAAVPAPPPPAATSGTPAPGSPPPPTAADGSQPPPGLTPPTEPPPGYGPSGYNPPGYTPPPPPGNPPPPPGEYPRHYGRLGADPDAPPEPGSWDPWAHPVPGRFSHEGFFMRLSLGPSVANVWRPDYRWTGLGLGMGLSVGGSLIENLALHADFNTTLMSSPTEHSHGHKNGDFDGDIVFESMGLGLTYYIMPVNIYVSGSVGVGVLVFEDDNGASKDTSAGLTLGGTVGKEWWVGSDWGLGVAAQLQYMRVKDYVDDARMNGLAVNVLFSATYN